MIALSGLIVLLAGYNPHGNSARASDMVSENGRTHISSEESIKNPRPLRIFAASSLIAFLDKAKTNTTENTRVPDILSNTIIVTGPSGTLARQIAAGAPSDIFISANEDWITYLQTKGMINGNAVPVAENQLALAVPKHWDTAALTSNFDKQGSDEQGPNKQISNKQGFNLQDFNLQDFNLLAFLANQKLIAVADPQIAPLGKYTKTYLENIKLWKGSKLWDGFTGKIAFANNARQTLLLVERGNMPGFVYQSSAYQSDKVKIIANFEAAPKIKYYAVQTTKGKNPDNAQAFIQALTHASTNALWQSLGFTVKQSAD
jgi:molybdate transport system substrate-binding protein